MLGLIFVLIGIISVCNAFGDIHRHRYDPSSGVKHSKNLVSFLLNLD